MPASWIIQLRRSWLPASSGHSTPGPEKVIVPASRRKLAACAERRTRWSRKRTGARPLASTPPWLVCASSVRPAMRASRTQPVVVADALPADLAGAAQEAAPHFVAQRRRRRQPGPIGRRRRLAGGEEGQARAGATPAVADAALGRRRRRAGSRFGAAARRRAVGARERGRRVPDQRPLAALDGRRHRRSEPALARFGDDGLDWLGADGRAVDAAAATVRPGATGAAGRRCGRRCDLGPALPSRHRRAAPQRALSALAPARPATGRDAAEQRRMQQRDEQCEAASARRRAPARRGQRRRQARIGAGPRQRTQHRQCGLARHADGTPDHER